MLTFNTSELQEMQKEAVSFLDAFNKSNGDFNGFVNWAVEMYKDNVLDFFKIYRNCKRTNIEGPIEEFLEFKDSLERIDSALNVDTIARNAINSLHGTIEYSKESLKYDGFSQSLRGNIAFTSFLYGN